MAFDIEDNSQKNLSREEISNIVEAFCGRTEKAGYFVSVYANLWWLNNKISDRVKEHYDIWLAQWADAPSTAENTVCGSIRHRAKRTA